MIVKVYENLHFPGEAFQMANALFALIPEARLRGVMGALHRFSCRSACWTRRATSSAPWASWRAAARCSSGS